jgi:hypothetical protein
MQRLLAVCVFAGAMLVVASSGAAVQPQTFNLLEVSESFVGAGGFDANGSAPPKAGEGFIGTSTFYKWSGAKRGARFGTLDLQCTFLNDPTGPASKTLCTAIASFPAGKLTVIGLVGNGNTFDLPILGGTGVYAGAKGYVRVRNIGGNNSNKSADTIVITG